MQNLRIFLFGLLALIILFIYQQWYEDYATPKAPPVVQTQATSGTQTITHNSSDNNPDYISNPVRSSQSEVTASNEADASSFVVSGETIEIHTDVMNVLVNLTGGDIVAVDLPQYPVSVDEPDTPFKLLSSEKESLFIAQYGITQESKEDQSVGRPQFSTTSKSFTLADGEKELTVPLIWKGPNGITVEKKLIFERDSYRVYVDQSVANERETNWEGKFFAQLLRTPPIQEGGFLSGARSFTGAVFSTPDNRYQKIEYDEIDENKFPDVTTTGGWVAMIQHYFLAAWIPPQESTVTYYSDNTFKPSYTAGFETAQIVIKPGEMVNFRQQLFVGPKLTDQLEPIAQALDRTVDYGYLFVIAKPMFIVLKWIEAVVGNWGVAIILLTALIKLAFFKLSEKSYKSMAKMKTLAPKMKQLKERYGEDKQKLNAAMMELYKKEKANPLGGCLPILVQMPFFIALYWMLQESVELRQAPFIFWINDLSLPDTMFTIFDYPISFLPLLMGASMFFQQRLNPAPMDPTQQRVMMLMPVMFTVMFMMFPSGLVLYWVVNNILSIAQQWVITKRVQESSNKPKPKKKK